MAVADFNLDGRPDLATANFNSDNVTILLGDGTGNFNPAATAAPPELPRWAMPQLECTARRFIE